MTLYTIGINHKTAPIEIREQFYLSEIEQELFLSELKCNPTIVEAFVISTCNRTEIYIHTISKSHDSLETQALIALISRIKKLKVKLDTNKYFYFLKDTQAIEHLFEVVTGLDSLVLGEKQILGQVKTSLERAKNKGLFLKHFNILANSVIRTGKKAHTETQISYGGSSVSWAAITKAEKHLGDLSQKSVLLIGAGKMTKLAVGQLCNKGFNKLYIMNRTAQNAQKLAEQYDAEVVQFCDIKESLSKVDLCICSVSAPHYILHKEAVEKAMKIRQGKMLMLIDISMPRNIDPLAAEIPNVKLYSIDDLDNVVEQTMQTRKNAVADVQTIIDTKLKEFYAKIEKIDNLNQNTISQPI